MSKSINLCRFSYAPPQMNQMNQIEYEKQTKAPEGPRTSLPENNNNPEEPSQKFENETPNQGIHSSLT